MTVNGICHTMWEDVEVQHICGKAANHASWHGCPCGAVLMINTSSLTDEQRALRANDCPVCLAKHGRPCHTRKDVVMTGVHRERRAVGSASDPADGPCDGPVIPAL